MHTRTNLGDLGLHMLGYAAAHALAGTALAIFAALHFTPGGEAASVFEAVQLQVFIVASLFLCGGAGYLVPLLLTRSLRHRTRVPRLFGAVGGILVIVLAGAGRVSRFERAFGVSSFLGSALLGFAVGLLLMTIAFATTLILPKQRAQ